MLSLLLSAGKKSVLPRPQGFVPIGERVPDLTYRISKAGCWCEADVHGVCASPVQFWNFLAGRVWASFSPSGIPLSLLISERLTRRQMNGSHHGSDWPHNSAGLVMRLPEAFTLAWKWPGPKHPVQGGPTTMLAQSVPLGEVGVVSDFTEGLLPPCQPLQIPGGQIQRENKLRQFYIWVEGAFPGSVVGPQELGMEAGSLAAPCLLRFPPHPSDTKHDPKVLVITTHRVWAAQTEHPGPKQPFRECPQASN